MFDWEEIKFQALRDDTQHAYGVMLCGLIEPFCEYYPSNFTKDEAIFLAEYGAIHAFHGQKSFKFADVFYVKSFIRGIYMIVTDKFPHSIEEKREIYQRYCTEPDPDFEPFPPLKDISMERYEKLFNFGKEPNDLLMFLQEELEKGELTVAFLGALDFCKHNDLPPALFKKDEFKTMPISKILSRSKKKLEEYMW
ncbi:MAG: hypothetical protein IKN43_11355 [Selenomonadaceae bacterium]|nr:hypothetical protein [Selenomonadaceae bacterium]